MKKTVNYLTLAILMIYLASCSKENNLENNTSGNSLNESAISAINEYYQSDIEYDGRIFMVNDYMQTKYNQFSSSFAFQGYFPDVTTYNSISFNEYVISIETNKFYSSNTIDSINLEGNMSNYFGFSNSIQIDGNNFINDFYVPSPVIVDFPNNSDFTFNKSKDISINFSVDNNNVNPVILALEYVPDNATDGDIMLTKIYYLNSQITNFVIPAGDLSEFPIGEKLIMYVGCGNGELVTFDNKTYDLEGINITYLPGIKLY